MAITSEMGELGFGLRKVGRGLKKAGRGIKKVGKVAVNPVAMTKFAIKSNIAIAKLSAKLALLPLKFLIKAVRALGRVICKAPRELLNMAAQQAGVDPVFIPAFCQAVQEDKWSLSAVRRMLPPAMKIALKLGASGAFPPIVPALAIVKHIPGVGKFAGVEFGSYRSNIGGNPMLRHATDLMAAFALADRSGLMTEAEAAAMGLRTQDRQAMQTVLNDAILGAQEIENMLRYGQLLSVGLAVAAGVGIYLTARNS
jgi:hypothetical protein